MNAVLSLTRAQAIALTGERSAHWIQCGSELSQEDAWPHLVTWVAEKDVLIFLDDASEENVVEHLSREVTVHDTVLLIGMIFDKDIPLETRAEIAADVERAIDHRNHFTALIARLYSEPFPSDADFEEAEKAAMDGKAVNLRGVLKRLQSSQPAISTTVLAWEAIPDSVFVDSRQKAEIRANYRDLGLFQSFACQASEQPNEFLFEWLPSVRLPFSANHRRILMEWTGPFRKNVRNHSDYDWHRAARSWESADDEQLVAAPSDSSAPKRRGKYYPGLLTEIELRKEAIKDIIRNENIDAATTAAESLVSFQLEYGQPRHASMSLCDLARFAQQIGAVALGLRFIEHGLRVCPNDRWALLQHASLLRAGGRTSEALTEYQALVDANLPPKDDVIARCGYAECLRDLGSAEEALDAYQRTLAIHDNNVVARNGYGECLRDLGKPDEAFAWYLETLALHPNYVFTRTGYATCLRELGRSQEALEYYVQILAAHPDSATVRTGYAECLRDLNRIEEAMTWHVQTLELHPNDIVARNAYAECLRDLDQPSAGLEWYRRTLALYPNERFARCGAAECLRELGRHREALDWYADTLTLYPNSIVSRNGYAECLRDLGRTKEALACYEKALLSHPNSIITRCGYAECLRDLRRSKEALKWYETIRTSHPDTAVVRNAIASLLLGLNRYDEALRILPTSLPRTKQEWITWHIRGMAYLRAGDIDAARRVFERGRDASLAPKQKAYFHSALALSYLRKGEVEKTVQTLEAVQNTSLRTVADIIRIHAFGIGGRIDDCQNVLRSMSAPERPLARELVLECERRFVQLAPTRPEEWLFDGESELLRAA